MKDNDSLESKIIEHINDDIRMQDKIFNELKNIGSLNINIDYIKRDLEEIKKKITSEFVTRDQFYPIQRIVYGFAGLILTSVVIALITLVIKK